MSKGAGVWIRNSPDASGQNQRKVKLGKPRSTTPSNPPPRASALPVHLAPKLPPRSLHASDMCHSSDSPVKVGQGWSRGKLGQRRQCGECCTTLLSNDQNWFKTGVRTLQGFYAVIGIFSKNKLLPVVNDQVDFLKPAFWRLAIRVGVCVRSSLIDFRTSSTGSSLILTSLTWQLSKSNLALLKLLFGCRSKRIHDKSLWPKNIKLMTYQVDSIHSCNSASPNTGTLTM